MPVTIDRETRLAETLVGLAKLAERFRVEADNATDFHCEDEAVSQPDCPIVDILGRLIEAGHTFGRDHAGDWHCYRADRESICYGSTFRDLCVNIVLAGVDA